jgi:membrane dipeptidase
MTVRAILTLAVCCAIAACGPSEPETTTAEPETPGEASRDPGREIAQGSLIVDTHIDVPYRLEEEWADVSQATEGGDFDYPRAVSGGLNAAFMSIYTPADLAATGGSKVLAEQLITLVEDIAAAAPDRFGIAYSAADVVRHFEAGILSLPMGMENGSPLESDLANVGRFYERGIRYITLAHSKSNALSDSSYDDNKHWGGLSDFGVEVVAEMNRLGMMVDVSHVSDEAFYDVIEVTRAPVIASHSSARHFTPGWERNMSDEMIVRLAENGGVIMINFGSAFISEEAWKYGEARSEAYDAWREKTGAEENEASQQQFREQYGAEHGPYPYATLDQVLDHFDHVVALSSVEHVGIGSDYDGVGDSLPIGLKDVSDYPNLVNALLERGYSAEAVKKILGENFMRVWRDVESVAASLQERAATAAR